MSAQHDPHRHLRRGLRLRDVTWRAPAPPLATKSASRLYSPVRAAEHAAVTAAIKRAIEEDHFPPAPRLDRLRSALAKLDPAAAAALWRPQVAKSAKSAVPQPRTAKAAHGAPEAVARVDQFLRAENGLRLARLQRNETSNRSFSTKWPPHEVKDV